ncbi:hypothetical protein [Serratia sp. DD3]|uniref:hypothetical protein n=1 Tax=Serratia sp. DD3 TaxID=1410619 RepID=UPI0003C4F15F|nr:hypothetical protein [Serratia sp. DD3]KEY59826.1 hypothetical protein SRDD_12360 [Serratia sp. DD3]
MLSGKSNSAKIFLIKIIASILCCVVLIFIHDLGHYIYTNSFTPRSKGVGLGFVSFYLIFVISPSLFVIPFVSFRMSVVISILVLVYPFLQWFSTNPLRVILIVLSGFLAYLVAFLMRGLIDVCFKK